MLLSDIAARAHDDPSFTPRVRVPFCPPGESPDDLVIVGLDAVQARVMAPVTTAIAKKLGAIDVNFMCLETAA